MDEHVRQKYGQITTLSILWMSPSVTVAKNHLCMSMVQKSEVETLNILKFPLDVKGIGRFATVSQASIRTSDGS